MQFENRLFPEAVDSMNNPFGVRRKPPARFGGASLLDVYRERASLRTPGTGERMKRGRHAWDTCVQGDAYSRDLVGDMLAHRAAHLEIDKRLQAVITPFFGKTSTFGTPICNRYPGLCTCSVHRVARIEIVNVAHEQQAGQ